MNLNTEHYWHVAKLASYWYNYGTSNKYQKPAVALRNTFWSYLQFLSFFAFSPPQLRLLSIKQNVPSENLFLAHWWIRNG